MKYIASGESVCYIFDMKVFGVLDRLIIVALFVSLQHDIDQYCLERSNRYPTLG
jgi:hypothetical protein